MPDIDYGALAKQNGAISSQPAAGGSIDYEALAKQNGAVSSQSAPATDTWDPRTWDLKHNPVTNTLAGIGSGLASTGVGAYNLARKIPGVDQVLPAPNAAMQATTQAPAGFFGGAGKFLEQAGEFLIPAGLAADATKGAGLLARASAQALAGGGVSAVQSGGNPASIATGAALGAAGPVLGAGIEAAAPSVGSAVKKVAAQVLGRTTGAGTDAVTQAIENPTSDLVAAMRGQTSEGEVVSNFKQALQHVVDTRSSDYQNALANLPQDGPPLSKAPIQDNVNFMLDKFGVKPGTNGALDFSRSTITDPKAQQQVRSVVNDVAGWGSQPGDLTPSGMDTLKRRIGNMFSDDSQGSAFIASTRDAAASVLKDNVPGYADMTKGYETASKFIDSLGDLSLESKNPGTTIRKLATVMSQKNEYRQVLTDALSQYTNVDLKGQLAGLALNKAAPSGATNTIQASLSIGAGIGIADALRSGAGLLGLVSTGYLAPMAAVSMALASPRRMGELILAMGKAAPALKAAAAVVPTLPAALSNAALNPGTAGMAPSAAALQTQ
jgi:hypothetical protein